MLEGFKKFIARGNVMDLAVGVIIGAAFGAIVDSLVKDIITPIIGLIGGQPDFSAIKPAGIGIGSFVNSVISFLMKAAALYFFIVVPFNRFAARFMAPPPPPPPGPTPTEALLGEIRDALKGKAR
jgi:large conductance mechanosensitive channel